MPGKECSIKGCKRKRPFGSPTCSAHAKNNPHSKNSLHPKKSSRSKKALNDDTVGDTMDEQSDGEDSKLVQSSKKIHKNPKHKTSPSPKKLSTQEKELSNVRKFKEDQLCDALEKIAKALHTKAGYNSESTTTVAWIGRDLLVTHQKNKQYNLDELADLLKDDKDAQTLLKAAGKSSRSVVDDEMIRLTNKDHQTGLHGEGRIVRYLYALLKEGNKSLKLDDAMNELENFFQTSRLYIGSSQGACSWCKDKMMNRLGIKYKSIQPCPPKDRSSTWRHPLTLGLEKNDYHHPQTVRKDDYLIDHPQYSPT